MRTATRHRMTTVALAIGLAAAIAPAAQANFPDGDGPVASDGGPGLAERARIEPRLPAEAIPAPPAAVLEPVSGGFDWADFAVGAGVALGGTALVGGTLVAFRRHGAAAGS